MTDDEIIKTGGIKFSEFIFGVISLLFCLTLDLIVIIVCLAAVVIVAFGPFIIMIWMIKYLLGV